MVMQNVSALLVFVIGLVRAGYAWDIIVFVQGKSEEGDMLPSTAGCARHQLIHHSYQNPVLFLSSVVLPP